MFISRKHPSVNDVPPLHPIWLNMVALVLDSLNNEVDHVVIVADSTTFTMDMFAIDCGHRVVMAKQRMNRYGRYAEEERMFQARYAGVIFATYAMTLQPAMSFYNKTGRALFKTIVSAVFAVASEAEITTWYNEGPYDFEKHVCTMGVQFIRAYVSAKKIQSAWRDYRARHIFKSSKFDMNVAHIISLKL